jgi:hypothetical protein
LDVTREAGHVGPPGVGIDLFQVCRDRHPGRTVVPPSVAIRCPREATPVLARPSMTGSRREDALAQRRPVVCHAETCAGVNTSKNAACIASSDATD